MKGRLFSSITGGFVLSGILALGCSINPVSAQENVEEEVVAGHGAHHTANFQLAARFAPYKLRSLIKSTSVSPNWIEDGDRFWYQWNDTDGTYYYIVDPSRGSKREIFDNDRIAAELTRITKDPWDGQHMGIRNIKFIDDNTLQFEVQSTIDDPDAEEEVEEEQEQEERRGPPRRPRTEKKVFHFEYDVTTRTLRELEDFEEPDSHPGWASVSPDSSAVIYNKECNLYQMGWDEYMQIVDARRGKQGEKADSAELKVEVEETQLTTDGEKYYCYGSYGRGQNDEETEENWGKRQSARVLWSHDSRYFAMTREDEREVKELWVVHAVGNERPQLETYKYEMPGEEHVGVIELLVFDMESREMKKIDDDPWKDQRMGIFADPSGGGGSRFFRGGGGGGDEPSIRKWLSPNANELYFYRRSRDQHRVDLMVADPITGEVRVVVEERLNTYVEHQSPRRLDNGDLIWWSEQDGWAHLYRYGSDGTLKARLTEGPWHVQGAVGVDEARGHVFFNANGREEGEDPYYTHLYRVNLDGSGLMLLNPGEFDHRSTMPKSNRFFVDNYSRVNTVPASALFDAAGRKIMELEEADFSALMAAGYRFPEPYRVKAADGVTDIYGVIYKPFDFDEKREYPIVAYVYPGPQTESVAKAFSTSPSEVALAQFGMVVITIGNRGGHPNRSKWYHNYGYGNLRDYGLADKKAGIEQLADRHDFIDIDRVGIYGHSGGGFMSTAAMLVYPDFFKVAVSSSGNHNNDVYNLNWSEKHDGVKEVEGRDGEITFEYDIDKNSDLAKNLKGKLLLTTGDVDNNVHHAGTFRMAEALIRANKRFDFFVFPGQRHGYGNMGDYWFWLRAEYFVKHLLGDHRFSADIMELNNERAQSGGGSSGGNGMTRR
jgi:dipeptidyl aminopeptidase/acylaminoacyl peptidase